MTICALPILVTPGISENSSAGMVSNSEQVQKSIACMTAMHGICNHLF